MLRRTHSLRFQLTLWSLATTAVILLIASVLCYALVRAGLQRETDRVLAETAARTVQRMTPSEAPEPGEPPDAPDPAAVVREPSALFVTLPGIGSDAVCLRLVRAGTAQTVAVSPLAARPPLLAVLAALPARPHGPAFAGVSDDTRLRYLAVSVPRTAYLLQVAVPWDPVEDLLTKLSAGLVFACALFLLLSGIGSRVLVGRALRPISLIVSEAETLTPDRLGIAQLSHGTLSDTEIGHLTAALNRMLGRISGSVAAQRQFTADASHELRTPLTILRGQFELALSRPRSAAEHEATLASGLEEVLRMSRIIESLAYLARGEAAGPNRAFVPVSLSALAVEAVGFLEEHARAKNVGLVLDAGSEAVVLGDGDALHRLIQNLLENAVAYTPPGGTVTAAVSEDTAACRIVVRDTGIGIAAADLPFIFDRFFRADPARVNTGGSGLGLSLVRTIADTHGGEVRVSSEIGRGSVFTVRLPREKTLI